MVQRHCSGLANTSRVVVGIRLLMAGLWMTSCFAFFSSSTTTIVHGGGSRRLSRITTATESSSSSDVPATDDNKLNDDDNWFLQGADIVELTMKDHRPLGCTVEESLGKGYENVVFCSKVKEGGFAAQLGIVPGDVFIGVSGMFGDDLEDVTRAGIERVKKLVAACPDDVPLKVRLARGTDVMEEHEAAVVDLCSRPDKSDSQVEECVVDFLAAGYYTDSGEEVESEPNESNNNDKTMLDDMFNMWAEDLPSMPAQSAADLESNENQPGKPKPWSSRSSPSGTFVRDPRTGKMINIDS